MSGSILGKMFRISTWGESHGKALGVVIDGCPAGIKICEDDIQKDLDRRKPKKNNFSTQRKEDDMVEILSGVFAGKTTGTPISMIIHNTDKKSADYTQIAEIYRPGHADYTYDAKYGFRDYRGGGRASGRETAARVAAGAVARKMLGMFGIDVYAYTYSMGEVCIDRENFERDEINNNAFYMPDKTKVLEMEQYLDEIRKTGDSIGGIVECIATKVPAGIGEPVFEKLDAMLAQALMSIGGAKGVEIGAGFEVAKMKGSENNDSFRVDAEKNIIKTTNNSGGILGGISDSGDLFMRVALKPTPSIYQTQKTVNKDKTEVEVQIQGRHDVTIVPRAAVVVEAMTTITIAEYLLQNVVANIENIKKVYNDLR